MTCQGFTSHNYTLKQDNFAFSLHKKIELFMKATEQHSMFYKNARQTYQEKYHEDIHYNAVLKIYEDAIRENNA